MSCVRVYRTGDENVPQCIVVEDHNRPLELALFCLSASTRPRSIGGRRSTRRRNPGHILSRGGASRQRGARPSTKTAPGAAIDEGRQMRVVVRARLIRE